MACSSLDPRFVYVLDDNKTMYIWMGKKAKLMTRTKARLDRIPNNCQLKFKQVLRTD